VKSQDLKKLNLPDKPGVYFFMGHPSPSRKKIGASPLPLGEGWGGDKAGAVKQILYIGKATNLRDRVRSYFAKDLIVTRGPGILDMVTQSETVEFQETDSVLEAIILEASLIKKHQPKYNTKEKSDKSFYQVIITDEPWPKVMMVRSRDLKVMELTGRISRLNFDGKIKYSFGPFPSGTLLRESLKIIRKIFPFIDHSSAKKDQQEFYKQLGLLPPSPSRRGEISGISGGEVGASQKNYLKTIQQIKLFFQGKKQKIINDLEKQMNTSAKELRFEEADSIKRKIFALQHINDISLIKDDEVDSSREKQFRIEAFDIAHISGTSVVGVMTVVTNGLVDKSEYKKFKIRSTKGNDDYGNLRELLTRRLNHPEWGIPDLIVVDGGLGQYQIAEDVLKAPSLWRRGLGVVEMGVISVIKDDRHKPKAFLGPESVIKKYKKEILLANSEAHRFAIQFHKQLRNKNFIQK
jgi:excinuclease ABC subunit C